MVNVHEEDDADEKMTKQDEQELDLHSALDEHHDAKFHESGKTKKVNLTMEEVFAQVYFKV